MAHRLHSRGRAPHRSAATHPLAPCSWPSTLELVAPSGPPTCAVRRKPWETEPVVKAPWAQAAARAASLTELRWRTASTRMHPSAQRRLPCREARRCASRWGGGAAHPPTMGRKGPTAPIWLRSLAQAIARPSQSSSGAGTRLSASAQRQRPAEGGTACFSRADGAAPPLDGMAVGRQEPTARHPYGCRRWPIARPCRCFLEQARAKRPRPSDSALSEGGTACFCDGAAPPLRRRDGRAHPLQTPWCRHAVVASGGRTPCPNTAGEAASTRKRVGQAAAPCRLWRRRLVVVGRDPRTTMGTLPSCAVPLARRSSAARKLLRRATSKQARRPSSACSAHDAHPAALEQPKLASTRQRLGGARLPPKKSRGFERWCE